MPGGAFGDCGIFEPPSQVQAGHGGHPKNQRVVSGAPWRLYAGQCGSGVLR